MNMGKVCISICVAAVVLMQIGLVQATIIHVPGDHPTIQAGIDAAVDGDTVVVADGTYYGPGNRNLDFKGKAIAVTSQTGPESTIIDCQAMGRGFYFHSGETSVSAVSGFTITNGSPFDGYGGAICCVNSSPSIENNIITENSAGPGGGIYCNNSSPVIEKNEIRRNSARSDGGGIYCVQNSCPTIQNNTITGNWTSWHGGGIYCSGFPTIRNNDITGNWAAGRGGGICCYGSPIIGNNHIAGNSAGWDGGGIRCYDFPTIENNHIIGNSAGGGGGICCGGICCSGSATIRNNQITENSAHGTGGGIYCKEFCPPRLISNTVSRNSTDGVGGGISCWSGASPIIVNTILWGDSPDEIFVDAISRIDISYSDIEGGWPGEANINADPLFVDGAKGDYHMSSDSPCIATGTMTFDLPETDIEGNPRPNPPGSAPDMGAYESSSGQVEWKLLLYRGWNLISLPYDPATRDLLALLEPVWQYCNSVWAYDAGAGEWLRYIVGGPAFLNNLTTIEPGKGYWLYMVEDATLALARQPISDSIIELSPGWNLVGYNSGVVLSVEDALSSIEFDSIWTYDSATTGWLRYIPDRPAFINDLVELLPGKAYWIQVNGSCRWDLSL